MAEAKTNGNSHVNGVNGVKQTYGTSSSLIPLHKFKEYAGVFKILSGDSMTTDLLLMLQNYGDLETTNMCNMKSICKIQKEVEALQIECDKKDEEIDKAKRDARQLQDQLEKEKEATAAKEQELERAAKDNNKLTKRLELLESFAVKTTSMPKDEITKHLEKIQKSAFTLVNSCFSQDLEEEVLCSENFKPLKLSEVPLPMSNSADAKRMRVATVLGHLGQAATRELFQPVYVAEGNEIGELLEDLEDEEQADWLRRSLLGIDEDCQGENMRGRVKAVKSEVAELVSSILSPDKQRSFSEELVQWCRATADVWMKQLQPLQCRVVPFIDPDSPVTNAEEWEAMAPTTEWRPASNEKKKDKEAEGQSIKNIVARVWPVFTMSDTDIVKKGLVVTKAQAMAAKKEEMTAIVQQGGKSRINRAARRSRKYSTSVGSEQAEPFLASGSPSPSGSGDGGSGGDGGGGPKADTGGKEESKST